MFLKFIIPAALSAGALLAAQPGPTPDQERELLREVKVPDSFEARIFAVPPAVNYPVFVAAAADGTVYVSSDKNGSLDRAPNRGRVLRVRDSDGDGHADEVKEFVPNVDSPRGLVWDRDRLYLLHPPHLSAFIDRDGDGVADGEKLLVKNIAFGFKDRPADHSSNGLELGVDGWIYCAIGDFGFMAAEGADGVKLQLRGGGVVRVRPDGSGLELFARGTRNILEACVSPRLDVFARDNTNDGDGWDIRLHHLTGLSEHGYPSLFKHFKGEYLEPLADYGGGSGCGGLYLSEPGFPEGFGEALYTTDWGREWVYRHRLSADGAGFTADQSEFVRAPRVTDLDVDASGRLYVASWKGASFTYVGENVGFLALVTPKGYRADPLPDFRNAPDAELTGILESPSHRRRLAAQRELLHRDFAAAPVAALARDEAKPLPSRIAALYLLALRQGEDARGFLESLLGDTALGEHAVRALCERGGPADPQALARALQSADPRVRREAAIGIARVGRPELAAPLATILGDPDPVVRHTAIQALKKLQAFAPCFQTLDTPGSGDRGRDGAMQVLQALHLPAVVDGLAARLGNTGLRRWVIPALARLHDREGVWKGDSWGTRPDTSGPYYQPERWDESARIGTLLKESLETASGAEAAFIAGELGRHKIQDPEILTVLVQLAAREEALVPPAAALLARADALPASAAPLLIRAARASGQSPETRAHAIAALSRQLSREGARAILAALAELQGTKEAGRELAQARQAFLRARGAAGLVKFYEDEAAKLDGAGSAWAEAALIALAESGAGAAIDRAWATPERRVQILEAIALAENRGARERVLGALDDPDPKVARAARETARLLRLERPKTKAAEPRIDSLPVEEAIAQAVKLQGDRKLGGELFVRQGCNNCHTISEQEPLRGPYLGNIAATYKRPELAAAILLPNRTIAQGFNTQHFELRDGTEIDGFVVQESAGRVTVRNVLAQEIAIDPKEIAARTRLEKSLMPEGLAANLTVRELASLLDYLAKP